MRITAEVVRCFANFARNTSFSEVRARVDTQVNDVYVEYEFHISLCEMSMEGDENATELLYNHEVEKKLAKKKLAEYSDDEAQGGWEENVKVCVKGPKRGKKKATATTPATGGMNSQLQQGIKAPSPKTSIPAPSNLTDFMV